ncbi:flagellar filament capping protein FliD [Sphingomonas sp. HITSZ_GF]|uniref:flagellar filament capping protein FliD n=1 Tax=Sphingomonas sp. HITSZ_GF TaxID=3037247 RepID=UPI00240E293A|nr:flagellar filament capping protein FliD [Sphingomonas sp. HITSZ_GF]MDG2533757.1 flagellar filament capping protein FliD [Sphingomonas sp. HITSZ_GF]
MAVESIAKTLGTGSGIDTTALVESLVENAFANKNHLIETQSDTLTTQISTVSTLKSNISDFASALASLTSSGSLATQPTSSNTGILTVTRLPGADLAGLNATMEVRQLAQGQVTSSPAFSGGSSTVIGTGKLTLTFGTATVADGVMSDFTAGPATPITIDITSSNNTLKGIADAINAKKTGLTASILSDSNGARLVLKSATGASQAFTLSGTGDLAQLDVGKNITSSTINSTAQDALVALDGVEAKYPTNSISGMISGARIDLVAASVGTKVSIGASSPTTSISDAVTNFVATYNEVFKAAQAAIDPITGPLRSDPAAKDLVRQLKSLTLTELVPGASTDVPSKLADIGVKTNRDGTLGIDTSRLASVLATYPNDVEKIFAGSAGLSKALSTIATNAASTKVGLGASADKYTKAQTKLEEQKDKVLTDTEALRARMTQQFAAMDSKVAAYKSTQSFLTQQIAAWNAQGN